MGRENKYIYIFLVSIEEKYCGVGFSSSSSSSSLVSSSESLEKNVAFHIFSPSSSGRIRLETCHCNRPWSA